MVFRTITNESTGAIKSIGLFGKNLDELKKSLSSIKTNGIFNTFFNISTIDETAVAEYNREIKNAITNGVTMAEKQQIMKTAMEGTNTATAQLIGSTKGAIVETEALIAAQYSSTLAAKAQAIALQALATAGNMIAMWAISKVIESTTTAINNYINRVEIAKEKMDSSVSSYESVKSELESISSELETQSKRIDELNAKDHLTYAEEGELERLQEITKELTIQQALKEKELESNAKQVDLSGESKTTE